MSVSPISSSAIAGSSPNNAIEPKVSGRSAKQAQTSEDIKKAAGQFEAIILRQLLTPAIEPLMSGGLAGGGGAASGGGGVYGYMLTDTLADSLSKGGGLGLTQMLSRQLTPRGFPPETAANP
ncbi:MAG TPA: rod-binding protein [Opitutaceae bacterium]|nr:rod-binding protein [Opitutaceae bacterium]